MESFDFALIINNEIPDVVSKFWGAVHYNPGFVFDIGFLDDEYENLYKDEQKVGKIMRSFTLFAILISCLGLFGLSAFSTQKRIKEIGI